MEYVRVIMFGMGVLFFIIGMITKSETALIISNVWVVGSMVYGS
jgi:hypothetical protein